VKEEQMKFRAFVVLVVVAAVLVAALAPAAFAGGTGVKIKLTGPSQANDGAMIKLTASIQNSLKYGGGNRVALVLQNKNGDLKRIGSKAITWSTGGSVGTVSFWVTAQPSAMGMAKYRAAWRNPGGSTHSNVWEVEIN
jgi:ABC-type glycerol-3-phosphate transport system substrate-binding protein